MSSCSWQRLGVLSWWWSSGPRHPALILVVVLPLLLLSCHPCHHHHCCHSGSLTLTFHPQSTPRAVAREAGGGWCVVQWLLLAWYRCCLSLFSLPTTPRCCCCLSSSHLRSTPQAVACEAGGRVCRFLFFASPIPLLAKWWGCAVDGVISLL
jgi:hypothetical protein